MDFDLSDDQQQLMTALDGLLEPFRKPPHGAHDYVAYSATLQAELASGGFLEIASQPGFGPLDAALMIEAVARCPVSAEVAASTLVGPLLGCSESPISLVWSLGRPARYLPMARLACLLQGDDVLVGTPEWAANDSIVAYPLGSLIAEPKNARRFTSAEAQAIRRRARIGIAAEAAGLMRGALDLTVDYVKTRQQFGQPLGHFQAIQHRLAEDAVLVHAARNLALRAAWEDSDAAAETALFYAQEAIRKLIYDCHQFHGAMGLTLEYPLHLWTYRLKFLQGEAGGKSAAAQVLAADIWRGETHGA